MKINKQQIEFFKSYISDDSSREILNCLYLDISTEHTNVLGKKTARLVATNNFCLAGINVEVEDSDDNSYLIPYKHLEVAKTYLEKDEELYVNKIKDKIFFKTNEAVIRADEVIGEFPKYDQVIDKSNKPEYAIKVSIDLLKKVIESHKKLGQSAITIKMSGDDKPISFEGFDEKIISILMPIRYLPEEELGKFQKENYKE